jgi:antitoxin HicB
VIYEYSALLTADPDGGFVVKLPDFPEAITQGDSREDALTNAQDCLEEAVANRIVLQLPLPSPVQRSGDGVYTVLLPANTALKAAFYTAIRQLSLSKIELAAMLGVDEREVRRLLDPYHASKLTRIVELLERIGKSLRIELIDASRIPSQKSSETTAGPVWDEPAKTVRGLYVHDGGKNMPAKDKTPTKPPKEAAS